MMDERDRIRLAPKVRDLHALGERPLLEFLIELSIGDDVLADDIEYLLDRYRRITPEMVVTLNAREIKTPLAVIEGGT